ncbi:MAG TPA: integrase arm-type DNA-binding domain-containing protein [Roseiarcus sp.]|jgi:integrase
MGRKATELTAMAIRKLKDPGLYFVGGVAGLAIQVLPSGNKTWILRATMIGRRRRDMGLGGYPDVTLAGAREAARTAREKIRSGVDPIEEARRTRAALMATAAKVMTFKDAATAYIADHEKSWANPKHRQQWKNTLEAYAHPVIGKLSVADIELPHILKILEPIWTGKTETATRVRGRIETILDWATVRGHRTGLNPARWKGHLNKVLAEPSKIAKVQHHAALPIDDTGEFMQRLRVPEGMGARALEFAILTAARSGEVRGATWDEIDLEARVWTVPASRMKAGREHRVPLSRSALDLLKELPRMGDSDLLFPAARGGQLSDMTLAAVLRRMKVNAVPHGFRSSFRDWAAERTAYPGEMAELALAHTIGDKTEAAYRRGTMFERRRRMMDDWAGFLAMTEPQSGATPIRGAT